jgi:hypothetical protein
MEREDLPTTGDVELVGSFMVRIEDAEVWLME